MGAILTFYIFLGVFISYSFQSLEHFLGKFFHQVLRTYDSIVSIFVIFSEEKISRTAIFLL